MSTSNEYRTYDERVPNEILVRIGMYVGYLSLVAGAVFTFIGIGFKGLDSLFGETCYYDCSNSEPWYTTHWGVPVAALIIGWVLAGSCHDMLYRYFQRVTQGKIIKKDTSGGGNYSLEWQILVYGNTLANTQRAEWKTVSAGKWMELEVGEWIDFA